MTITARPDVGGHQLKYMGVASRVSSWVAAKLRTALTNTLVSTAPFCRTGRRKGSRPRICTYRKGREAQRRSRKWNLEEAGSKVLRERGGGSGRPQKDELRT